MPSLNGPFTYGVIRATEFLELLNNFLVGTQSLTLQAPISDLTSLPHSYRARLREAEALGRIYTAWTTDQGPVAAWGEYDRHQSAFVHAHVLFIEWSLSPHEHHAGWWHCYQERPREWICGRGRP